MLTGRIIIPSFNNLLSEVKDGEIYVQGYVDDIAILVTNKFCSTINKIFDVFALPSANKLFKKELIMVIRRRKLNVFKKFIFSEKKLQELT